jgi:hypothetical protein
VSRAKATVLQSISDLVPPGTTVTPDSPLSQQLTALTTELIDAVGRDYLQHDPFAEVYDRQVAIDMDAVRDLVENQVVLVTGGCGFVGQNLIAQLLTLGVRQAIALDIAPPPESASESWLDHGQIRYEACDVRNRAALQRVFALTRPQVVFHLAAQRLPGLAETQVYQTVTTNLLGSQNVIDCCETYGVATCVFSSTGKASRYYTPDIYAGSKKIAEWLFSDYSQPKRCAYGLVRFTHVVENSPISAELDQRVADGLVSLHAPDRYIYAQNIQESVNLLLQATLIATPGTTRAIAVRDLGWPINTLEVALHKIVRSGRPMPLYFKGLPAGYERHVFMGQLDLSGQQEVLPMLNVLEVPGAKIDATNNTVIFQMAPFDALALQSALAEIGRAVGQGDEPLRHGVNQGVKTLALSTFLQADSQVLQNILHWGTSAAELTAAGVDTSYHQETIDLLDTAIAAHRPAPLTCKFPLELVAS